MFFWAEGDNTPKSDGIWRIPREKLKPNMFGGVHHSVKRPEKGVKVWPHNLAGHRQFNDESCVG